MEAVKPEDNLIKSARTKKQIGALVKAEPIEFEFTAAGATTDTPSLTMVPLADPYTAFSSKGSSPNRIIFTAPRSRLYNIRVYAPLYLLDNGIDLVTQTLLGFFNVDCFIYDSLSYIVGQGTASFPILESTAGNVRLQRDGMFFMEHSEWLNSGDTREIGLTLSRSAFSVTSGSVTLVVGRTFASGVSSGVTINVQEVVNEV
jgi:hypothetical protein